MDTLSESISVEGRETNSNTYAMIKAFFCAGLESGIRLSTPARGYDNKNEKMSFTTHHQLV